MKRIVILFIAVTAVIAAYSQTYFLQDGDRCFDSGDYLCAITNYERAFKSASGKDKQSAEIKLTRAKWCDERLKIADQAFNSKNYTLAKDEYQNVLDSNPKDSYAQSQLEKCEIALNPTRLRKATAAELTDIWNGRYGTMPARRQNLINVGIDPNDAQTRMNAGEGKPQEKEKPATNLRVSKSSLYFFPSGGTTEQIKVYSNASSYSIPSASVPSWCTVETYSGYFTVTASANPNSTSREDWFNVTAGGKEVKVQMFQSGSSRPQANNRGRNQNNTNSYKQRKCFNCPKAKYSWGLSLGYVEKELENPFITNDNHGDYSFHEKMEGVQLGLRFEPLFKYGLGLNTGIFYEYYTLKLFEENYNYDSGYDEHLLKIPLHLEYRFNFSRHFNLFAFGGSSIGVLTNNYFEEYSFQSSYDYGGGIRIDHFQINVEQSIRKNKSKDLIISCSYMF